MNLLTRSGLPSHDGALSMSNLFHENVDPPDRRIEKYFRASKKENNCYKWQLLKNFPAQDSAVQGNVFIQKQENSL